MSNNNFRSYTTSSAFHLSLSQNMIDMLATMKYHELNHSDDLWDTQPSHYLTASAALGRRGLLEREPTSFEWEITEAGRVAYELCKLAGLVKPGLLRKIQRAA